jgi:hypothetical protein
MRNERERDRSDRSRKREPLFCTLCYPTALLDIPSPARVTVSAAVVLATIRTNLQIVNHPTVASNAVEQRVVSVVGLAVLLRVVHGLVDLGSVVT